MGAHERELAADSSEPLTPAPELLPPWYRALGVSGWLLWSIALGLAVFFALSVLQHRAANASAKGIQSPVVEPGERQAFRETPGRLRLFETGDGSSLTAQHWDGGREVVLTRSGSRSDKGWTATLELPGQPLRMALVAGEVHDRLFVLSERDDGHCELTGYELSPAEPSSFEPSWVGTFADPERFGEFHDPRAFQVMPGGGELVVYLASSESSGLGRLFRVPVSACERPVPAHCAVHVGETACAAEASVPGEAGQPRECGVDLTRTLATSSLRTAELGYCSARGGHCAVAQGAVPIGEPIRAPRVDDIVVGRPEGEWQLELLTDEGRSVVQLAAADLIAASSSDL